MFAKNTQNKLRTTKFRLRKAKLGKTCHFVAIPVTDSQFF